MTAIPWSYTVRKMDVPTEPIRVEVDAPSGATWTWGPEDAANVVRGNALDLALVVTQRRHRADTDLVAEGPVADEWLSIAQAFAGPPGPGRKAGQFRMMSDATLYTVDAGVATITLNRPDNRNALSIELMNSPRRQPDARRWRRRRRASSS